MAVSSGAKQAGQETEYYDHAAFLAARDKITGKKHNDKGIGTLSEKTVHGVLKNYFEPDEDCHEVALDGYFADIYNACGVTEIQTRSLNRLREKLAVFLNHYPVTVVYPMPCNKWVSWIDVQSGAVSGRRKSPKHFTRYDAFYELYKIKQYLKNPNICIKLVLMDMEEYRLLDGWNHTKKQGSTRFDRIPLGIREIIVMEQPEDYMQFIPYELGDSFTSSEFAKACGIGQKDAQMALNILYYMGTVCRVGKQGNAYVYRINEKGDV